MHKFDFSIYAPDGRWEPLGGLKILSRGAATFCPPGQPIPSFLWKILYFFVNLGVLGKFVSRRLQTYAFLLIYQPKTPNLCVPSDLSAEDSKLMRSFWFISRRLQTYAFLLIYQPKTPNLCVPSDLSAEDSKLMRSFWFISRRFQTYTFLLIPMCTDSNVYILQFVYTPICAESNLYILLFIQIP